MSTLSSPARSRAGNDNPSSCNLAPTTTAAGANLPPPRLGPSDSQWLLVTQWQHHQGPRARVCSSSSTPLLRRPPPLLLLPPAPWVLTDQRLARPTSGTRYEGKVTVRPRHPRMDDAQGLSRQLSPSPLSVYLSCLCVCLSKLSTWSS